MEVGCVVEYFFNVVAYFLTCWNNASAEPYYGDFLPKIDPNTYEGTYHICIELCCMYLSYACCNKGYPFKFYESCYCLRCSHAVWCLFGAGLRETQAGVNAVSRWHIFANVKNSFAKLVRTVTCFYNCWELCSKVGNFFIIFACVQTVRLTSDVVTLQKRAVSMAFT